MKKSALMTRARTRVGMGVTIAAVAVAGLAVFTPWTSAAADPEDWVVVDDSGNPLAPEFAEGIANLSDVVGDGIYYDAQFRMVGDTVQLRGVVAPDPATIGDVDMPTDRLIKEFFGPELDNAGPWGIELFTLPCEMRPSRAANLTTGGGDLVGDSSMDVGLVILPDGRVFAATYETPHHTAEGGLSLQLSVNLDGAEFYTDGLAPCETATTTTEPEVTTTTEPEVTTTTEPEVTTTTEP